LRGSAEVKMNKFNEKEFAEICKKFNGRPSIQEAVLIYQNDDFFEKMKNSVAKDRRGEVVFCVIRPNRKIITITCDEYPDGIYRIPTGGISYGEDIVEAVFREVKEELGLDVVIDSFARVIKIRFEHKAESVMFYSYIFILKETGGRLLVDAIDDEISEVKEVDLEGLEAVVDSLNNISGKWGDWGRFRYVTSKAVLEYLRETGI